MPTAQEKLKLLQLVAETRNKSALLREFGLSKSTYYLWRKKYAEQGIDGLEGAAPRWSDEDDRLLQELAGSDVDLSAISDRFPGRTRKAIEERIRGLGISLVSERVEFRTKHGKQCSHCHERKPLREFYDAKYESIDGKMSLCKACFLDRCEQYRKANQDHINAREKKRRNRIRTSDPDFFTEYQRNYRRTARGVFQSLKQRCRSNPRRKKFELEWSTFEHWYDMQGAKCHYCGISLSEYLRIRENLPGRCPDVETLTIDRIDARQSYHASNIILACFLCNYLKGYAFSYDAFREIAEAYVVPYIRHRGAHI